MADDTIPSASPYDYSPIVERDYELPGDNAVAAWVAINVEHFRLDEPYWGADAVPDVKTHGRREYGNRVGFWRLLDVLDERDVPATIVLNSDVCDTQPRVVEEIVERDWPIIAHGTTNSRRLVEMDRETERETIQRARDRIESFTGEAPAGWMSPGLRASAHTAELIADAGFSYVCDWCADDQPFAMDVDDLLSVPYSLDLNDKGLFGRQGLTGAEYRDALVDACATLRREANEQGSGRVLPIPLHSYIAGQSFRAPYLGEVLDRLTRIDDVWFTTADEIAAQYREQQP
jgi:peptidoglycan/xylan/chitin deacetylase (PgdA/CDA1 family)